LNEALGEWYKDPWRLAGSSGRLIVNVKDREYYERRRAACLANAERARTPTIAKLHRDFAAHYEALLTSERSGTPARHSAML